MGGAAPKSVAKPMPSPQKDPASQRMQKQLVTLSRANRQHENNLAKIETKLQNLDNVRRQKLSTLIERQKLLQHLVQAIQQLARQGPEKLVAAAQKPDDLIRAIILLRSLLNVAVNHNKELQIDVRNMAVLRQNIDAEKEKLKQTHRALIVKSKQIEALLKQRQKILQKEIARRKKLEAENRRLAAKAKSMQELMRKISAKKGKAVQALTAPVDRAGTYEFLPVQGEMIIPFGSMHPQNPDGLGTLFKARAKGRVLSPVDGQIIFAGPFRLYQKILIIKHNSAYYTILSGLDRLDVDVGQEVEAGEPIGLMAQSGSPLLYLELRRGNTTVNPKHWIAGAAD